jgi:3-oxoacid CoA-transferase
VELLYHPLACEVPTKRLALEAIRDLFTYLPLSKQNPDDVDIRQRLLLAAYSSLFPFLYTGGVGLSHSIGHAVGATYNIPHGITSCLTLSSVIEYKAATEPNECIQISRILPYIGNSRTGNAKEDSRTVSTLIADLINRLGHKSTLSQVILQICQLDSYLITIILRQTLNLFAVQSVSRPRRVYR